MGNQGLREEPYTLLLPKLAPSVTFPADLFNTASLILPHRALHCSTGKPTHSLWEGESLVAAVIRLIETQHPGTQLPKAFALFLIMPQQGDNIHSCCVSWLPQSEQISYEEQCLLAAISLVIIPLQPEDRQDQLQPSHLTMHHFHHFSFSSDKNCTVR